MRKSNLVLSAHYDHLSIIHKNWCIMSQPFLQKEILQIWGKFRSTVPFHSRIGYMQSTQNANLHLLASTFICMKWLCIDRESSDEIRLLSIYIVAKSIASINHGQLIMQIKFMVCSRVPINAIIRLEFDDYYDIARQNVFKVDNLCLDIYSSRLVIMIQLIISF